MMKKLATLLLAVVLMMTTALPAFAAEFTPSVEGKAAPEIIPQIGKDGKEYAAIIRDADGNEVMGVPIGELIVTPVSQTDEADAKIRETLESAYAQLKSVSSLTELSHQLETVIKAFSPDMTVDDLVVRDLFDVSVTGTCAEYLAVDGNTIHVRFALLADANLLAAVLHNVEATTWETLTNDLIVRNADNTADLVFHSLSPVAFLFDAGKLNVDPDGPSSPQTGEPESGAAG